MSVSLDQFRTDGTLEARGHFRLDENAAREKLQQFRLKDPHTWVLELVRAAHIGEAVSISFSIGPGRMSCSIDGVEIPAELAKEWAHAPFENLGSKVTRILRHVAIALASLQGLGPKRVAFEAGLESERVRIEIENGHERSIDAPPRVYSTGSGIRVESEGRFTFGVRRFFESILGELAEVSHLKKSCQYPLIPLFINEQRFGTSMHIRESDVVVTIQSPVEDGVLGLREVGFRQLGVYQHGVLLEELVETVDGVWNGYEALVNTRRVKTDLGGQRIVRDKSFDELQRLVEAAWCRAVEIRVKDGTFPGLATFVRQTLQNVEVAKVRNADLPPGLQRLAAEFDSYPVWRVTSGDEDKYVSVEDLRRIGGRRLHYVTRLFSEEHVRAGELILFARRRGDAVWIDDVSIKTLESRLDRKMYDMSGQLQEREEQALNEARWRRSPVKDPKLTDMLASTSFQHIGGDQIWDIEVGFGFRTGRAEAIWIKDGRLLGRHRVKGLDVEISISGDIPPNRTFTGADPRSKRVRSAVVRVVEETLELAIKILQGQVRTSDSVDLTSRRLTEVARRVVKLAINGELADYLVVALGLDSLKWTDIGYSDLIKAGASTTMRPSERIKGLEPILKLALYRRGHSLVSLHDLIQGPQRIVYEIAVNQQEGFLWESPKLPLQLGAQEFHPMASEDVPEKLKVTDWELRGLSQVLGDRLGTYEVSIDLPESTPVPVERDAERHARLFELTKVVGPSVPFISTKGDMRAPDGLVSPKQLQHLWEEQDTTPLEIPEHLLPPKPIDAAIGLSDPYLDNLTDWILSRCDVVFGAPNLRGLRPEIGSGKQVARVVGAHVELDSSHPIVGLARRYPNDVVLMGLLGSSVYTVINCHFLSVEDHHEHTFLGGVIDLCTA